MTLRPPTALKTTRRMICPTISVLSTSATGVASAQVCNARCGYLDSASVEWPTTNSTASSSAQRNTTATEAVTGRQLSCALRSRGGCVSTRNCSVMTTASVDGECSYEMCQICVTTYSDARAASGGVSVCTTTINAIRMLCLMSTGSVIAGPSSDPCARPGLAVFASR